LGLQVRRMGKNVGFVAAFFVLIGVVWELYKWLGVMTDATIPLLGWEFPINPDDTSMPHVWSIIGSYFEQTNRSDSEILLVTLLKLAWMTLRGSIVGLSLGVVVGLILAMMLVSIPMLERAFLPWLVASQTVPLVAIAPMVVIWGGRAGLPIWFPIALIAAFLCFVPVAVNALRGLKSPTIVYSDLMKSYASSRIQRLRYLDFPSSIPHLFSGLRLAATASVVGTLVGELSAGTGSGLGRAILNFTYYYVSGPEKLYAAVVFSAVIGILFVQVMNFLEFLVRGKSRQPIRGDEGR
jgi:NitT/TauT family transport system permease protein